MQVGWEVGIRAVRECAGEGAKGMTDFVRAGNEGGVSPCRTRDGPGSEEERINEVAVESRGQSSALPCLACWMRAPGCPCHCRWAAWGVGPYFRLDAWNQFDCFIVVSGGREPRHRLDRNERWVRGENSITALLHSTAPYMAAVTPRALLASFPGVCCVLHPCL